jgi:hypothetical protein
MFMLHVNLRGSDVYDALLQSGAANIKCSPTGELTLSGLDIHFNFAPYGLEVETEIRTKRVDNGELLLRKGWISFPYHTVLSVTKLLLWQEEESEYNKLYPNVSTNPIGFLAQIDKD